MARRPLGTPHAALTAGLVGVVLLFAAWTEATRPVKGPHGRLELALLRGGDSLVWVQGAWFTTAGRCEGCHGHDPAGIASIDADGNDINVVDDWRSTMMANSARDPFWRAKVSHEVLVNPAHQEAIETTCLGCHAPLAVHEERLLGRPPFTMAMLDTSHLGRDGVSCLSCHMQSEALAGSFFTGQLEFDSARVYGPYFEDQIHPEIMADFVGYTPGFGAHIVDSRNCAGCHTLITHTVDLGGQPTGGIFVEQATYHEWLNSTYPAADVQCNTCHMPRTDDPIILAADYLFLNPQSPFGKHHFAGANVHMLELMKANRELLGIPATEVQFDSTIARTRRMLQQNAVQAEVMLTGRDEDTARFALRLHNLAGHRFPSGYPSRRAFVDFTVLSSAGDTLFRSGALGADMEVAGNDAPFEPHHDLITSAGQVQIYEMVMGDVLGDPTTVLERAADPLKDNRIPPVGFTTAHISYDTTRIVGVPPADSDFNRHPDGTQGSGADVVRYHVPMHGHTGGLRVLAALYYQSIPPRWTAEMLAHSTPEIDAFRAMLEASDGTPVRVAADSLEIGGVGVAEGPVGGLRVYPNPSTDGRVRITSLVPLPMAVDAAHDAAGRRVDVPVRTLAHGLLLTLPAAPGTYLVRLRIDGAPRVVRVVRR
ncbi:MAG: multiheme c-type cytochrome [Flavobacteriales bacterium]|jgi:hypothetical protein|nr:multiheme c-type cytochrome [Flavobacteriales bacterium]